MITRTLASCAVVLVGWLAVLAGVTLGTDRAPAALVMWPDRAFMAALPPDAAIVARSPVSVTLAGTAPEFAKRLYHAGALLVLPAGLQGCAPLATTRSLPGKGHIVSTAPP